MFAKKSYGQHFLKDISVIEKILTAAEIAPEDLVVEVGPGTGALTKGLSEATAQLVLVEADQDLLENLRSTFPKVDIIHADAAKFDFSDLIRTRPPDTGNRSPEPGNRTQETGWIFVSNLPYNAGNAILMNVLTGKNLPKRLVIMVQKEVGERMMGKDPGVLSVAVLLHAQVEKVCIVPPGAFSPPPKVDSIVLKLVPHPRPLTDNPERVLEIAKAGFANRRKQLHKNLAEAGLFSSEDVKAKLVAFGFSPLARAEELSLKDWIALAQG